MTQLYNPSAWRHRVWQWGKYVVPGACMVPSLRSVPAPIQQVPFAELLARYPDRVHARTLGIDASQPAMPIRVIDHGRSSAFTLEATAPTPVVVYTVDGGSSVGRGCCLVGPGRTAIRETGFCLDRGFAGPFTPKKLDPRYWWHRSRGDLTARFRLREPEHVPGRVVVLNNWRSHNFYHWLVEVAPRAAAVELAGLDVAGYLVDHRHGYQRRVLELLGIPPSRWIQPHAGLHLSADQVLWVSQPLGILLRHFVRTLAAAIELPEQPAQTRRLFISRRRAVHRRLINERELEQALERLGFESVCLEDMPFERQAALMREASLVVAVHGSALANAMFASPGTRIVEIYPQRRSNMNLYPFWSRLYGLDHHVVLASCSTFRQRLTVPVRDVLDAIAMGPTSTR